MLILLMIEDMLGDLGCTSILSAATNDGALTLLAAHEFDAVLVDMNLSGTSSHPVAERLAISGIPFVYVTGSSVSEIEDGFKDRPYLRKPFGYADLASALGGLIHR